MDMQPTTGGTSGTSQPTRGWKGEVEAGVVVVVVVVEAEEGVVVEAAI